MLWPEDTPMPSRSDLEEMLRAYETVLAYKEAELIVYHHPDPLDPARKAAGREAAHEIARLRKMRDALERTLGIEARKERNREAWQLGDAGVSRKEILAYINHAYPGYELTEPGLRNAIATHARLNDLPVRKPKRGRPGAGK